MRRIVQTSLLAIVLLATASGCAYVNVRTPYDTNLDNTELGSKVGEASSQGVLWLFAWGDAGYAAAARNGDIKVMKHSDRHVTQYLLGLYTKMTTIVYGD